MPTVTATQIIDRAGIALQDTGNVRWRRAELLEYINAGQRETVIKKPNAYVLRTTQPLVVGTVQTLPITSDDGAVDPIQLVDIPRNASGRAVRVIQRDLLDQYNPDWHLTPQGTLVQHYMYDVADPKRFLVYPPNDGTGCVEVVYSATPPALTIENAVITLDDIYQDVLLDYCVYRAFSKDAEYAADPARAAQRYAAFAAALDGKSAHERGETPPRTRK